MTSEHLFEKLPVSVVPKHYQLHLKPDLNYFTFDGEVAISIEVNTSTEEIKLHSLDLDLISVNLKNEQSQYSPITISLSKLEETAAFKFAYEITPGTYILDIKFKGKLEDNMKGFYRSKYVDDKGKEFFSAVSHFAPVDARRSFPCWDEPALKATFDICLTVPKYLTALSNMSVVGTEHMGDLTKYMFNTSPKMSTYLVAFAVGDFDFVEKVSSDGVLIRVYTPLQRKEQGQFALDIATNVLSYYKNYFSIAYPLPKLDLIAVASLGFGAMENWGLITYRETRLLIDSQNSSAASKQTVALVVAHELAHQWFGNLVTMKWWTDLWLNEGYATFAQFLSIDDLYPQYDVWSQFVNTIFLGALELDSLNNSHPIEVPIDNPCEINDIFDSITYNKGASIIRMLVCFLGNDKFREGMTLYLERYKYSNTSTEDLWSALEEGSQQPVAELMSTWTKQKGFPLIKVETSYETDGIKVKLSQRKFMADGSKSPEGYHWIVPISISCSHNPNREIIKSLLTTQSMEVSIPGIKTNDWVKINPGVVGFYRTQYSDDMLVKFMDDIRDMKIPSLDRLGLLEDIFALVKAGYMDTVAMLKFLKSFENEIDSNVWITIINILSKLGLLIEYTSSRDLFEKYQRDLLSKRYQTIGWDPRPNDTHIDALLRSKMLNHIASIHDQNVINEARVRFEKHLRLQELLHADVRSACYRIVVSSGGKEEFQSLLNLYASTDLNEEKLRISGALGYTTSEDLIKKLLEFAMSNDVKTQDAVLVLIAASQTKQGRVLTWKFIKDNWATVISRFTAATLLQSLIKNVTQNCSLIDEKEDIERFFKNKKYSWVDRCVLQVLESISVNVAWLKRDSKNIEQYLSS